MRRNHKRGDRHSPTNNSNMSTFQKYSAFYDLLYQDKDYAAEAAYVARTIRVVPIGAIHGSPRRHGLTRNCS